MSTNAGTYTLPNSSHPRLKWARAWTCGACKVSWYDGGYRCIKCGEVGEPEALPHGAVIVDRPSPAPKDGGADA